MQSMILGLGVRQARTTTECFPLPQKLRGNTKVFIRGFTLYSLYSRGIKGASIKVIRLEKSKSQRMISVFARSEARKCAFEKETKRTLLGEKCCYTVKQFATRKRDRTNCIEEKGEDVVQIECNIFNKYKENFFCCHC